MEDFSNFITEEIFILSTVSQANDEDNNSTIRNHKLAVITGIISEEESILLNNILSALHLKDVDIYRANEMESEKCEKWLIFADSYELESKTLEYYKPTRHQDNIVLLAQPLSTLRDSQQEKQKLWNALKGLFVI